jgi:hypothetical protein
MESIAIPPYTDASTISIGIFLIFSSSLSSNVFFISSSYSLDFYIIWLLPRPLNLGSLIVYLFLSCSPYTGKHFTLSSICLAHKLFINALKFGKRVKPSLFLGLTKTSNSKEESSILKFPLTKYLFGTR